MRKKKLSLAITYAIIAAFLYAVLGLVIKQTEKIASTEMTVFFRQIFSIITLSPLLLFQKKEPHKIKTGQFPLHMLRAFASLASMYCLFFALKHLPLSDALILSYTRPLFIPIVVFIWFKKKWTRATWWGLITGFLGVALILKPDQKVFDIAALVGLGAGLFGAVAFTAIRRLTRTESANTILLYYLMLSIPIAAFPLVKSWTPVTGKMWILFAILGVLGTTYQQILTRAFACAKAHKVSSALYSTVIFAALFDWYFGDFSLDYFAIIGILLIFVGTLITVKQKKTPYPPENPGDK